MSEVYSEVVKTARDYYDSDDADNFYFHIWGGEDIHIGLYQTDEEPIATASRRTVEHMADKLGEVATSAHILDIGAGYGGAARYLADRFGCKVTALNLSAKENARNVEKCRQTGLDSLVDVVEGSFEAIPLEDGSVDMVWSQDAILHSGNRKLVVAEVARVLNPGGRFIFTDPMESGACSHEDLEPVLARLMLDTLGSVEFYTRAGQEVGLKLTGFEDRTEQLIRHYSRVAEELLRQRDNLAGSVSQAYIDRMLVGLDNWVKAGRKGCLSWGIAEFEKAA